MIVSEIEARRALELVEQAQDMQPKVKTFLARVMARAISDFCEDTDEALLSKRLLDIRGLIRGAVAFSREVDRVIKSGSLNEED